MQPQAERIQDIALYDPIAAYGMALGIPRVPIVMNCVGTFSTFAVPQPPIEGDLDTTIATRTWIDNIQYSILVPNVFSGNIFKTLYDAMLKVQPGISVQVAVQSGPRYIVSVNFTPLEGLASMLASRWPAGWPLYKQQSIATKFMLTQPQPSTGANGPPMTVTLTFAGWQFLDQTLDAITANQAAAELKKMGFCVTDNTQVVRTQ